MARNYNAITLGAAAQRTDMLDIRCGRCEPHGRSTWRGSWPSTVRTRR
jgi:hypothetical protein